MSSRGTRLGLLVALLAPSCKGNINRDHPVLAVTNIVSVTAGGGQGNGDSTNPSLSADGRFVAFESSASDLVPNDTNGLLDVFVKDLQTGSIELISVNAAGTASGAGSSQRPSISADGRYVAFDSTATDLVSPATTGTSEVFVRDRLTQTTALVSLTDTGVESATEGPSGNFGASLSADGSMVVFSSDATDLVTGVTVPGFPFFNVFRHPNAPGGGTLLVSVATGGGGTAAGATNASASADGQVVAFVSSGTDLVAGIVSGTQHIYLRNIAGATTELVSQSTAGIEGSDLSDNPQVNGDGSSVVFQSQSTNLAPGQSGGFTDIFVRNRSGGGSTTLVSVGQTGVQGTGHSVLPTISPDGQRVAFQSFAADLVSGDTNGVGDVFWRDLGAGITRRVSVGTYGAQANGPSPFAGRPVLSGDGRTVAFDSKASNLVAIDANGVADVFIHGPVE